MPVEVHLANFKLVLLAIDELALQVAWRGQWHCKKNIIDV